MRSNYIFAILFLFSIFQINKAQDNSETLEQLVETAINVSPNIKMLNSKADVSKSRIEIGTNLPDPILKIGLANLPVNSFSFTQEPMTGKIVGLSQKFPFPGKLKSASAVKAVDTSIVKQNIEDFKNRIRNEVSVLYYDLRLIRRKIELANESKELLKQITEIVKRKYEVSTASLQNLVQVEVQITRIEDKLKNLSGKENSILADLNGLLLRNDNSKIVTDTIKPIKNLNITSDKLLKKAKMNRPMLKSINLFKDKSDLMKENAEYDFLPNFNLGVQYSQRDEIAKTNTELTDFFTVSLGVSLPINYGGKKTEKVNEAVHLKSLYDQKYNSAIQTLRQKLGSKTAKLYELIDREKLIEKRLLPQAQKSLKASLSDFQVGKIDFVNVIKAEADILKIQNQLEEIRTNYWKNISSLEYLIGNKIEKEF